jgi:hypothetical protein
MGNKNKSKIQSFQQIVNNFLVFFVVYLFV